MNISDPELQSKALHLLPQALPHTKNLAEPLPEKTMMTLMQTTSPLAARRRPWRL